MGKLNEICKETKQSWGNESISVRIENDGTHIDSKLGKLYVNGDIVRDTNLPFENNSLIVKQELDEVKYEVDEVQKDIDRVENEVVRVDDRVDKVERDVDSVVEFVETEMVRVDDRINDLSEDIEVIETEVVRVEDNITNVSSRVDIVEEELDEVKYDVDDIVADNTKIKKQVDSINSHFNTVTKVYDTIVNAYSGNVDRIVYPTKDNRERVTPQDKINFGLDVDKGLIVTDFTDSYKNQLNKIDREIEKIHSKYKLFEKKSPLDESKLKDLYKQQQWYQDKIRDVREEANKIVYRRYNNYNANNIVLNFEDCI